MDIQGLNYKDVCDISAIHSNINGAKSHLDELVDTLSLSNSRFSIIGVSETRLKREEEAFFSVNGYSSLYYSRTSRNAGGGVGWG